MSEPSSAVAPVAALGRLHESIWVYAALSGRIEARNNAALLSAAIKQMEGEVKMYFGQPIEIRPGSTAAHLPNASCLVRQKGPGGIRIFEDTAVTSPKVWMPLQEKRVRYKKQPKAALQPSLSAAPSEESAGTE